MTTATNSQHASRYPNLGGRAVIITGASRGIGAATARAFAAAGARVSLAARDEEALEDVAGDIQSQGGEALAFPADVGEPDAMERLVAETLGAFGRLDAAFNNAAGGGHPPTPLAEVAVEDFDSALRVTLRGVFLAIHHWSARRGSSRDTPSRRAIRCHTYSLRATYFGR